MRKLAVLLVALVATVGLTAGTASARDTNWPCNGCAHPVGR